MSRKKEKSFRIDEEQLGKLKQFSQIKKLKPKSKYEKWRGKLEKSTLVVYGGKHALTLLIQNLTPEVEKIVNKIIVGEKKIIEIDDSGWGEPVGGVMIVGNKIGTDEHTSGEIPVKFFQREEFKSGKYYIMAVRGVNKILNKLKADPRNTKIRICSGTIFRSVYKFLEKNKYEYEKVKITGETQKLAEETFNNYLEKIGCPRGYKKMKKWLKEKPEERMKYAKTGWKEFNQDA